MNKNVEMMKKLLEEKKAKITKKSGKKIPDRYGKQSAGASNTH
ncbi:hypothetical protein [Clostridium sardiniense]